jgi:TonB family protein
MRYRLILWALVLSLLRYESAFAKDEKWSQLSSENFLLFTDAGEAKGRRLLGDLESRVAAISTVLGKVPSRQFPIEIFLFNSAEDYVQALPRAQAPQTLDKSAYLLRGPDRIFIVAKDKSPEEISEDVGHALGHVLFERSVLWRPFWLAEGVAEYFRKTGRSGDTKKFSEDEGFTAAELLTIAPSATYDDSEKGGAFRTLSYRLLRIFVEDAPDVLRNYFAALRRESESAPKIEIDQEQLNSKLKTFVEAPLKMPATAPAIQSMMLDPAKLAIQRGDLMLAAARPADAGSWYNGDSKEARAARAILVRFSRPPLEAVRALDRTARELQDHGLVQYHFGAMEVQDRKDIQAQILALERATQMLPLFGRAHAELARVYARNDQPDRAFPVIARALELEPEFGDRFYEIRSDINVAAGRFEEAFRDINIAAALPHSDRASVEAFVVKISSVRRKIENARRGVDDVRLAEIQRQVRSEAELREPPPKPSPPPPPIPAGRITYEIEARAAIEVVEAIYPDYPEPMRKSGSAGAITLSVAVGPDGKVKTASIASSQLPDLNTATLNAVKKWSFRPGNRTIRLIITYSLQ